MQPGIEAFVALGQKVQAPRDDRVEARETRLVNIGRGDVPAIRVASTFLETLASPRADPLGPETRCDALSRLVRVAFDISTMGRDDDEPGVHAVIVQGSIPGEE